MEKLEGRGNLKGLEISRVSVMKNHSQLTVTNFPPMHRTAGEKLPSLSAPRRVALVSVWGHKDTVTEKEHPSQTPQNTVAANSGTKTTPGVFWGEV